MIATDPLSLIFVVCILFSGIFLIVTTLMGVGHGHGGIHIHAAGHGHGLHIGGHGHGGVAGHHAGTASGHAGTLPQHPAQGTRVTLPHHASSVAHTAQSAATSATAPFAQFLEAINLNAALTFLFFFGLLGYLLLNVGHFLAVFAIIFAIVVGVVAAMAVNALILRMVGEETGQLGSESSDVTGRIAQVSMPIRAEGIGEVIYVGDHGERHSLGARSINSLAIPRDADVVIIDVVGGIAAVQSWEEFLAEARQIGGKHATP
jgi:membrane protein implicated in regulation of membrane protease activity